MLFKALVFGLLIYFGYKATRDLVRSMLGLPSGNARPVDPPQPQWREPSPPRRPSSADVEDARWEDLE